MTNQLRFWLMNLMDKISRVLGLGRIIPCCVCLRRAKYSASAGRVRSDCGIRTIRPICSKTECIERMKEIEKVDYLELTEINSSIYSLATR